MTMLSTHTTKDLSPATPRVDALRARAAARVAEAIDRQECELAAARSWLRSGGEHRHLLRRGLLAGDILRAMTPVIDAGELLVGKFSRRALTAEEAAELAQWRALGAPAMQKSCGQTAHMAIDYPCLLRQGITGIRARIARFRSRLDLTRADDQEKDIFYQGCLAALDGMAALTGRYAELAEAQAAETHDSTRRAELLEIARICRQVPEFPAETFHEAIQAMHFAAFCMCAGNQMSLIQFGRPDRCLLPYYQRDLAAGRLTTERAQELIDCLGILLNEYTPRGLAVGLMVGGRDETGVDVTNPLSFLFVESVGHVRLAYPGVGICWNPDTPPALLALAARLLARGYSHPALFNDEVITRGLLDLGLSYRDACQYIHSTCVEITPIAMSNVYVASPYYNLVQLLHDVLGIPALGGELGALPEITSFADLLARWQAGVRAAIGNGVAEVNAEMMSRRYANGYPLLSCFVNDCLARGKDIDQGGARVNWVECSFVGLANLLDALSAIRTLVFDEGACSLAHLRAALLENFAGYEEIKARIDRLPKYGNDDERVDALAPAITDFLRAECERHRSYWGDPIVPGFFCWIMHEALGRQTGASADGRVAGFPFADGSGPAQGREHEGPTAAIRSATQWNHAPMIGGIAVNLRFRPGETPDDIVPAIETMLETYLRLGGFEAQVNVVDAATLRQAQAHPEQYRDLVVRVAGYSDYFVCLSPQMQAEVMARTELE